MGDRCLGQDAVAEIEHEGSRRQSCQDLADPLVKPPAAGNQQDRIEIALDCDKVLQMVLDPVERQALVATDGVDAGRFHVAPVLPAKVAAVPLISTPVAFT